MTAKLDTSDFIITAKKIHGDKYSYGSAFYKGRHSKLTICCPVHGDFEQTAGSHLNGRGCPECGQITKATKRRWTIDEFIRNARRIHGDKYDYSDSVYVNSQVKLIIRCLAHGDFEQTPDMHVNQKQGCPHCGKISSSQKQKLTTKKFIEKAVAKHSDKYDYSLVNYTFATQPIKIICKIHGEFYQRAGNHLHGQGCPECSKERPCDTLEEFVSKAKGVHGDKYDYSKAVYVNSQTHVIITCPVHGDFSQRPYSHVAGFGCARCSGHHFSSGENAVFNLVQSIATDAKQSVRSVISPQELDIVVPSHKVAIEFNGIWWHSEKYRDNKYHLAKRQETEKAGYRLISIREDLWNERRPQIENIIRNALGVNSEKVYARKCTIVSVDKESAATFLEQYHIQGFRNATHHCGLMQDGELVAVMSVTHWKKKDEWELTRYATSCSVPGGLSRLWKYLVKTYEIARGYSYVDRDLFTGTSYCNAGFVYDSTTVGFRIVNGTTTESRQKWNVAPEGMTQTEWYEKEGVTRLYDSGQDKLIFTR